MTHRIGLLLAKAQTGRVYDYAYFMLLGLYAGLILMDFVVDPTGVGYLVESTDTLTSIASQTPLTALSTHPVHANQIKRNWWSLSATRQRVKIFTATVSNSVLTYITTLTSTFAATKQSATTTSGTTTRYTLSAVISR